MIFSSDSSGFTKRVRIQQCSINGFYKNKGSSCLVVGNYYFSIINDSSRLDVVFIAA